MIGAGAMVCRRRGGEAGRMARHPAPVPRPRAAEAPAARRRAARAGPVGCRGRSWAWPSGRWRPARWRGWSRQRRGGGAGDAGAMPGAGRRARGGDGRASSSAPGPAAARRMPARARRSARRPRCDTRALARRLAGAGRGACMSRAAPRAARGRGAAAVTLVGADGAFDLVRGGAAWDAPVRQGLSADELLEMFGAQDASV